MSEYYQSVKVYNFIDRIKLSEKRRAKYYTKKDKIPKKYQNDNFEFNKKDRLENVETGEAVIKNPIAAGTPRFRKITGQYFWSGANPFIRRKIKNEMSDFFYEFLKDFKKAEDEDYPIGVRIDLYDEEDGQDLDNFIFLYRKVIHDVLTAKNMEHDPIIEDDSKEYIVDIPTRYYKTEEGEDRMLNIIVYSIKDWENE